jgi:peptidoglycan/LPS O-acetylase OafA/YrhL
VFAILDASVLGIALMLFGLSHAKVEADPQAPKVTLQTRTRAWRFLGGSGSAVAFMGKSKARNPRVNYGVHSAFPARPS